MASVREDKGGLDRQLLRQPSVHLDFLPGRAMGTNADVNRLRLHLRAGLDQMGEREMTVTNSIDFRITLGKIHDWPCYWALTAYQDAEFAFNNGQRDLKYIEGKRAMLLEQYKTSVCQHKFHTKKWKEAIELSHKDYVANRQHTLFDGIYSS